MDWIKGRFLLRVVLSFILLTIFLSGCSSSNSRHETAPLMEIVLSDKGVGQITSATPFDIKEIDRLFKGMSVVGDVDYTEGEPYPVIRVLKETEEVLTINAMEEEGPIFSIGTSHKSVRNAYGTKVGDQFEDIYGIDYEKLCSPGMEELSGMVLCREKGSARLVNIFNGDWDGPDGQLPPYEVLKTWKVIELYWRPLKD